MYSYGFSGYDHVTQWSVRDESWQFSILGIFKREDDGKLFWAEDSGCSCPGEWENAEISDLMPLRENWDGFKAEATR